MTIYDQLRRDEGIRYTAYRDPVGLATLGVGHRLDLPISEAAVNVVYSFTLGFLRHERPGFRRGAGGLEER